MKNIQVYSTYDCHWCVRAKALLDSKGLSYEEIDISSDVNRAMEMVKRSGRRTVPQIFFDDVSIGGFDELWKLDKAGKLNQHIFQ
jgi:glutaredoxin 3